MKINSSRSVSGISKLNVAVVGFKYFGINLSSPFVLVLLILSPKKLPPPSQNKTQNPPNLKIASLSASKQSLAVARGTGHSQYPTSLLAELPLLTRGESPAKTSGRVERRDVRAPSLLRLG